MPLTATAIKAARPQAKPYKLFDEKGLFLSIEPKGGRLWRLKYYYNGKEKKLALGAFPEVGLKEARDKRDEARALIAAGVDPGHKKKTDKQTQALQAANTFQAVAEEFIAKRECEGLAVVTLSKARWLLELLAINIGSRPIAQITAPELLSALRVVEKRGKLETAKRMRSDAIERALAHGQDNGVRAAYSRGAYWDERVRMAQWWSDYLDGLRSGAKVIHLKRKD